MAGGRPKGWIVVLPLKRLGAAKSRLEHPGRALLALAMATDTAAAAAAVGRDVVTGVLLVTNDPAASAAITTHAADGGDLAGDGPEGQGHGGLAPVLAVPDLPDLGLNAALRHGARIATRRWPGHGIAAMSADLAALRPAELRAALLAAPPTGRAVLADAAGTGTVLLCAAPGSELLPRFGEDSHALHLRSGAVDLTGGLAATVPGLRRDVDTVADLAAARLLGVGPATSAALATAAANAG
ncbi:MULTISPECIES: 2-phospho-L-lactate guanylyltransferase [unclassified Pseudofrankia]|uniref:2-phospho-L-lactate guanylyltransferase n=1 Tax=unclassified Pseudofrankia TaxID=2994372 RepID=UPI0008D923BB|nr:MULTISPECIES: 2-phospho-L-lactate guanylyltransferase [unclassified Pseudofrankia]MDT3443761.1 2-phospho-L-lactate guanylyltransferase [Pseudofrankia sp. BMG5.37]OHV50020.1 2-phospho-L-lactate guanylyltransferase [Pseudofrankia sp. BMG5.36]